MPKRSYEEKMDHYMRKMEKLKEDFHRKRRRLRSNSLLECDAEQHYSHEEVEVDSWEAEARPCSEVGEAALNPDTLQVGLGANQQPDQPAPSSTPPPPPLPPPLPLLPLATSEPNQITDFPPLDPEVLLGLGEATDHGPIWGQDIHSNLSRLWEPLLKKGMEKELRDKFLKKYLVPSNCTLLQAPKLNIEISAAVIEMVRLRDKRVEANQQQLGCAITAISRAMTSLITSDNKIDAIKTLSDGCRILCDLHHTETVVRMKMITPGLAKPFLNVIQDSERDETLFGTSLPDKIKASKTIEKQGLQIKKVTQTVRPSPATVQNAPPARQQFQGNWTGPPRYSANRGGRGAPKRFPSTARRPPASATAAYSRPSNSRSRAPARQ